MGLNVFKSVAFVVPLAGLAFLMEFGEKTDESACSGTLAFEKARQLMEGRPEVIDMSLKGFRWVDDCRFAMNGYADVETGAGPDRLGFELLVAFDPQARRWQQAGFSMTR
ncbi:hypothetical protein [Neorhizobium petrolearium]|uniref:Uncharacterized protein n=1 Tax=Neorhizobium petrolearium TaxID=515361 RepID=A0ABY8M1A9_9HYPH|nr:hypothetical protein [Neorhizobium petrolearium]MCC2613268.1 hypothetical protein [Neorhizobium petrolearium]WGI68357.1 hypothetical protein QEO92_25940 [Neorhizobium petrolearium]